MPDEQPRSFAEAFDDFVAAYENKEEQKSDRPHKSLGEHLQEALRCLEREGYTKRDLIFTLDVEPLTVDRWFDGRVMRDTSYTAFKEFGEEIKRGKPQRVINVSDTALVTWRYVLENRQAQADRIWYISDGRFLLSSSSDIDTVVRNLFTVSYQQQKGMEPPIMTYLYPAKSETAAHLRQWETFLLHWQKQVPDSEPGQRLKGSIIGISIQDTSDLPWFLPGLRAILLERDSSLKGRGIVEGYIRVRLPDEPTTKIREVMAMPEMSEGDKGVKDDDVDDVDEDPHIPWLQVHRKVAKKWYMAIKYFYLQQVLRLIAEQEDDFHVHFVES